MIHFTLMYLKLLFFCHSNVAGAVMSIDQCMVKVNVMKHCICGSGGGGGGGIPGTCPPFLGLDLGVVT